MLYLLTFFGGVLAIFSPCILPLVPLVFARAGRSLTRETIPMFVGLAIAFAFAATIATSAARWLLAADEIGRALALLMMGAIGIALLSTRAAEAMMRPLARAGVTLMDAGTRSARVPVALRNAGIGAAIGLLWAPCAGPILGLVVTIAAGASTTRIAASLFFTFALGAVLSLGIVMSLAGRLASRAKYTARIHTGFRRALGVAVLATVIAVAWGWDATLFAKGGLIRTASAEEVLVRRLAPERQARIDAGMSIDDFAKVAPPLLDLHDGMLPGFDGATEWINSPPLTKESLKGKVVLVDFWTFACYNCLNALPHVKDLYAKYASHGLVVIGVHTPELPQERVLSNVHREVKRLRITYPVVVDNDYAIWRAFGNQYWPAAYYADANGRLRFHHFGEGNYEEQDRAVAQLLAEAKAGTR